ncbi:hypothetical protein ABT052_42650 [Streptomyces sp. NPDC002766]|uniref:SbtR family transcriptional regulator n=1 Tax=Streptomyces sp. NPDC002766 TaxID=3154429 RepID=UPI00332DB18C
MSGRGPGCGRSSTAWSSTISAPAASSTGKDSEAGVAFRETFREMVSGAPAKLALIALLEEAGDPVGSADEVGAASAALREAVEVLLSRGQQAGQVRTDASVDEVYVLLTFKAWCRRG